MTDSSKQAQAWSSEFGIEYTNRNTMTTWDMDTMYVNRYGVSRTHINERFLGKLDRGIRILEVGSNIGIQLSLLQQMGFTNLYGIEISRYAVELSKSRTKGINIIQGDASDIPFKDSFFDLVFTSGLLIHISPDNIGAIMDEIYRCSGQYIWGGEYYAEDYVRAGYRVAKETDCLMWKGDFAKMFCEQFSNLRLVRRKLYKYLDSDNEDIFYLLEKGGTE